MGDPTEVIATSLEKVSQKVIDDNTSLSVMLVSQYDDDENKGSAPLLTTGRLGLHDIALLRPSPVVTRLWHSLHASL